MTAKRIGTIILAVMLAFCCGCKKQTSENSSLSDTSDTESVIVEYIDETDGVSSSPASDVSQKSETVSKKQTSKKQAVQVSPEQTTQNSKTQASDADKPEKTLPDRVPVKPHKLNITGKSGTTADPHIFRDDDGMLYMYVTGGEGADVYSSTSVTGEWTFRGTVGQISGRSNVWAPCMIKIDGVYYLYYSSAKNDGSDEWYYNQRIFVLKGESPLGPFAEPKQLYGEEFTIDPHVVQTDKGLFIFYVRDITSVKMQGSRIFVDQLYTPYSPANESREILSPSEYIEISRFNSDKAWYTLEGPFYIEVDGWRYLMYSGGNYEDESYFTGYASAKKKDGNFLNVKYQKHFDKDDKGIYSLIFSNEYEEGGGHNSVIEIDGEYYMFYHGRDVGLPAGTNKGAARNARVCKLHFKDGIITAESIS